MSLDRPILPTLRTIDLAAGVGQTVFSLPSTTPIWDAADIKVSRRDGTGPFVALTSGFAVAVVSEQAIVTFETAPRSAVDSPPVTVRLRSERLETRIDDVQRAGAIVAARLEKVLDRYSTLFQEQRRDIDEIDDDVDTANATIADVLDRLPLINADQALFMASQPEAEAGTETNKVMPPHRVAQAIDYRWRNTVTVISGLAALRAATTSYAATVFLVGEDGRDGVFRWNAADVSAQLLGAPIPVTVNAGTDVITAVAHGLQTGFSVIITTAVNGLAMNTLYRVIRISVDTFKLATSWSLAKAGMAIDLTGSAAMTVRQHFDPLQARYVTPVADISGAAGAWVRQGDVLPIHAGARADGVTDDTEALQNLLSVDRGRRVNFASGAYITSLELWTCAAKTHIALQNDTEIIHNTPNYIALRLTNYRCRVSGGLGGGFTGPAAWDPTTGAVVPDYAVIWCTADDCLIEGVRIHNIRRIGIGFKDANGWSVKDCVIAGNLPRPVFPLNTTVHFGIFGDPSGTYSLGRMQVSGNSISGCCTGISVANYGGGPANLRSCLITGNVFEDMWDHCVYTNYSGGAILTNNTSHRCHTPVACSGPNNQVIGWSMYTEAGSPDERDVGGAISFRDAVGCIARDINIVAYGDTVSGQTVIGVDFLNVNGTPMNGNLVDGIRMKVLSGAAQAVRFNASVGHYDNVISNVWYDGAIRPGLGAIAIEGAFGYNVQISNIQIRARGGAGAFGVFGRLAFSRISNVQYAVAHNVTGGAPTTNYIVYLYDSNDTVVHGVQPVIVYPFGVSVSLYGVAEGTSGARNEAHQIKEAVSLAADGVWTPVAPLNAASQMLIDIAGVAAPAFLARAGSIYRRHAGVSSSFYVNQGDGNNWAAK